MIHYYFHLLKGEEDESSTQNILTSTNIALKTTADKELFNKFAIALPYEATSKAAFLKFPQKLAGIIALSGYLPLSEEFEKYTFKPNLKTPIFFGHGLLDEIVKPEWGRASERLLKDLGLSRTKNYLTRFGFDREALPDDLSF